MLTLLRIGWMNLKRDRVAQALTFLLPIVFFSIFASVFGGRGGDSTPRVSIAVVDEDRSPSSRGGSWQALQKEKALRVRADGAERSRALDRAAAERLVRNGDVPVAIVIPKGIGAGFGSGLRRRPAPAIQLLADPSDPIAPQMVQGLLQKVTMTAAPDLMMQGGMKQFERYAGALTPQQRKAVDEWLPRLKAEDGGHDRQRRHGRPARCRHRRCTSSTSCAPTIGKGSLISFYAAGIGVMFLLFSAVGGAGGALLEEAESGTLERLLSTNIGMTGLLVGKWLFLSLIGCVAADGDVSLGPRGVRPAAVLAHAGLRRDDGGDRRGRRGARPRARDAGANAGQLSGILDDPDPDHVGARRQHVPTLPDERDNAEDGAADVQRLGARRLSQGVLAQRRRLGALAAGAGARARSAPRSSVSARLLGRRWELA